MDEPDAAEVAMTLEGLVRLFRRLSMPSDLSMTTAATLASLDRDGPARLTELAAAQGVTQPAMTQLVTRLQEAGLAERAPDPGDGRVVRVHITDAGRAEMARRRQARTERLATLLERLPAGERRALGGALPAINKLARLTD